MTWTSAKIPLIACLVACNPKSPSEPTDTGGTTQATGDASTGALPTTGDPIPTNVIFVTSTIYNGDLGGLEGADAECNARAAAAGLPGEYLAWLSHPGLDAIARLAGSQGWVRPDGRPFADLLSEDIRATWYPPVLDEFSEVVPDDARTITGTNFEGLYFDVAGTCDDYTSSAALGGVGTGSPFSGFSDWSSAGQSACSVPMRLYCLGVGLIAPLSMPAPTGRLAFVSKPAALTGGLEAADAQCQAEADTNGLSGSFRALLASSDGSAASRFDLGGSPWFRLDGAQLFESAADLVTGRPLAPLLQQANGTGAASMVRLGAPTPGSPSDGACQDWSSASGESLGGSSRMIGALAYGGMTQPCADATAHYCLQE